MLAKGRSSHQGIIFKGTGKGQKQPPDVFYEKAVIFRNIQRNTLKKHLFEEHLRMAVSEREAVRLLSQSSSAVHNLIQQNFIEPGGNLLKDQEILDIKQCYLNIDYVRQFFLVQIRRSNVCSERTQNKGFEKRQLL